MSTPKTKNPLTFQVEGFGKKTCSLDLLTKNPQNHSQSHIQMLSVSMTSHLLVADAVSSTEIYLIVT
jgi:hypothetical protein